MKETLEYLNSHLDKVTHCLSGFFISTIIGLWISASFGFWVGVVVAIGKEIYDYFNRDTHTPDIWDGVWTINGSILAFINLLLKG